MKKSWQKKIGNNEVSCLKEKKPDKYKRILAECCVNDVSLSRYLVRSGYAFDYAYYSKREDDKRLEEQRKKIFEKKQSDENIAGLAYLLNTNKQTLGSGFSNLKLHKFIQ